MNKCWLLLFGSGAAIAADSRVITFEEAVRIALEQNISLRQAQNTAASAEVGVSEARMEFVPDLRFNTGSSQNYARNFSETEGRIVDESSR